MNSMSNNELIELAKEGMRIHSENNPEYKICAEVLRLTEVNRELVEALQEVCFQLLARRVSTDPDHPDNFYIRAAEAAIAKAKGGQL